jgi:hypothetical protein
VDGSHNMQTLRFDVEFLLKTDPAAWKVSPKYQEMKAVVDTLITNYNENLTKNEESNQNLLHVVKDNRQRLVNVNKATLIAYKRRYCYLNLCCFLINEKD